MFENVFVLLGPVSSAAVLAAIVAFFALPPASYTCPLTRERAR